MLGTPLASVDHLTWQNLKVSCVFLPGYLRTISNPCLFIPVMETFWYVRLSCSSFCIQIICRMASMLRKNIVKCLLLPRFCELCSDGKLFQVRKVGAKRLQSVPLVSLSTCLVFFLEGHCWLGNNGQTHGFFDSLEWLVPEPSCHLCTFHPIPGFPLGCSRFSFLSPT